MTKLIVSLSLVLLLIMLGGMVPADAISSARIEGQLVDMTAGTTSNMAGQIIIMQTYQGTTKVNEKTTTTGTDGRFSFDGLDNQTALVYVVQTVFQNVHYFADQTSFKAGENLKSLTINVYDTTSVGDNLRVEMSHVILSPSSDNINIKENYVFVNHSDLTYIGTAGSSGERETLKLTVPPGATDVAVSLPLPETPQIQKDGSFSDSTPVTPEGVFYSYDYKLAVSQDSKSLTWKFNYDTGRFDLLIDNSAVKANSSSLTRGDSLVISGKTYQDYWAEGIKRGDAITVQLSGLKQGSNSFNLAWLLLILIPVAALAAIWLARSRRPANVRAVSSGSGSEEHGRSELIEDARTRLMQEIAMLDDSFENGDLAEDEYRKLRQAKKEQLLDLSKNDEAE